MSANQVLKIAKLLFASGKTASPTQRAQWSPQEQNLFLQANLFLKDGSSIFSKWEDFVKLAQTLDNGGELMPPYMERLNHTRVMQSQLQMQSSDGFHWMLPGIDDISGDNICDSKSEILTECYINELMVDQFKGKIAVERILWVVTMEPCFRISGIQACVQDKFGVCIVLSLYNFISFDKSQEEVDKFLPINTKLGIKNPYLKVSNYGKLALRVDNPCNVIIERPPYSSLDAVVVGSLELKIQGNAFYSNGDYLKAIEIYTQALQSNDIFIIKSHSNRAISYLKLDQYEEAIVDCEEVLKVEPLHLKALHRKQLALKGMKDSTTRRENGLANKFADMMIKKSCDISTLSAEEYKALGDKCFAAQFYNEAIDYYSDAIKKSREMDILLRSNRAISFIYVHNFEAALLDCDTILKVDPVHQKASNRREQAIAGLNDQRNQLLGIYNYNTLPFTPELQSYVNDYYGPIEIRYAGSKGRGIFVTRDIKIGELLFVEKAICFRHFSEKCEVIASNFERKSITKESGYKLVSDLVIKAHSNSSINSKLSYLFHDKNIPITIIPSMDWFRTNCFPITSTVSAKRVDGIILSNSFSFSFKKSPTKAEREAMSMSLSVGVDIKTFYEGAVKRHKKQLSDNPRLINDKNELRQNSGSALWVVGSFMNHSDKPNVHNEFFGSLLVVHALKPLNIGEEIFISYAEDKDALKNSWGIY
eukprot:gene15582-21046_t